MSESEDRLDRRNRAAFPGDYPPEKRAPEVRRKTPVIYIAGPYRAPTPWEVELNVRACEAISLEVCKLGGIPLCPHTLFRHFDQALPDAFWLATGLELLRRADGLLLCPGWEKSRGSLEEKRLAEAIRLPVYEWAQIFDRGVLAKWLKGGPP